MPRLNHRKARTGCQRCKARKVKCDELRPKCSACARHSVSCEYAPTHSTGSTPAGFPTPLTESSSHAPLDDRYVEAQLDPALEIRLMHEWTAHACKTFSTAWEFWMYQAPLIAFEFRHVLDAILAVTALYASRQPPMKWIPAEGRMVPIRADSPEGTTLAGPDSVPDWKLEGMDIDKDVAKQLSHAGNNAYLAVNRSKEMLAVSRFYFDRAIEGHRRALEDLSVENIEAIYITSILVSFHAVFVLSESEEDSTLPSLDPLQWMRLSKGTRFICARWEELVGPSWILSSGVFYGKPDMTDTTDLFDTQHGRPFLKLLVYAEYFESITPEDRKVYQDVISYIGAIYKGISEQTEPEMASCRRIMGLPSRNDPRFIDFVEAKQPRALAILAHLFACMKLITGKIPWFEGIAERQIPRIYDQVPSGWRPMLAWPIAVMSGEIDREPKETYIEDILAL